jgi:hypothetical protein
LITLGGLAVVVLLIALPQNLYLRKTNPDALVYKPVEGLYFDVFYGEFYFPDADLDAGPIGIVSLGTQDQHQMFFDPETHARMIGRGLLRNALVFDDASLINGKHFIPGSLGGPTGSLLLIAGFAAALSARRLRNAQLIAVWAGVCLLLLTVLSSFPPQWTRLVPGLPALALLQSVGLAACLQPFRGAAMRWLRPVVYASIVAVIAVFGLRDYFVNMERDFPPPLLDVIAYAGYTADEPTQIFGVFEEDGRLNERPVLIDEFPTLATYTPVPRATLPAFEGPLLDAANPQVYFDVGSAQETLDLARRLFGDGDVTYYFDADGRAIGGSFVPTER